MATLQREDLELLLQKSCKNHILFTGYAKQAHRELKKNIARLFEALAFSRQIQALHTLQFLGNIGTTIDNLTTLIHGNKLPRPDKTGENPDIEKWIRQSGEKEEKLLHVCACALDSAEVGKDLNLGELSVCSKCGYVLPGDAPEECAVCHAPSGFFRLF